MGTGWDSGGQPMFGSQALETVIGLVAMFFVIATAASAITESLSRVMKKRASDLKDTILEMLSAPQKHAHESKEQREQRLADCRPIFEAFLGTSVWQAAEAASGKGLILRNKMGASYLSAKGFADAVQEILTDESVMSVLHTAPSLDKRIKSLVRESRRELLDVKAGLETWFDETMGRAEGAYKRWASLVLFVVGLFLAVLGNASTTDVAHDLWRDAATRAAVTASASNIGNDPADIGSVADETKKLTELQLPVGWDSEGTDPARADNFADFLNQLNHWPAWVTVAGWLLTAVLVMLGGPFWFDLLARLVALRATGTKPPPAVADGASATSAVASAAAAEPAKVPLLVTVDSQTGVVATVQSPAQAPVPRKILDPVENQEIAELREWLKMPATTGGTKPNSEPRPVIPDSFFRSLVRLVKGERMPRAVASSNIEEAAANGAGGQEVPPPESAS